MTILSSDQIRIPIGGDTLAGVGEMKYSLEASWKYSRYRMVGAQTSRVREICSLLCSKYVRLFK